MRFLWKNVFVAVVTLACFEGLCAQTTISSPPSFDDWKSGATVAPVSQRDHHSIHSYFNTSPESPDGRWVLYYSSTTQDGHEGEIYIRERATGKTQVLSRNVVVEDAHRAACQQWVCGGRSVVFHNVLNNGSWVVMAVDVETGKERVLAQNRQVGFGQPNSNLVPLHGCHWNPGPHCDLEIVDVTAGKIRTILTARRVVEKHRDWVQRQFGKAPMSIYIPILSPDLTRVFFKLATPAGGDFRSRKASRREGLFCYNLKADRLLPMQPRWGHPAWHPDSRQIFNVPGVLIDTETGLRCRLPKYARFRGSHPSLSPDGKLFTTDSQAEPFGGRKREWIVGVGDVATGAFQKLHRFDNSQGAKSWRVSHPHPVFSPNGRRIYFNVSSDERTRLYVATCGKKRSNPIRHFR